MNHSSLFTNPSPSNYRSTPIGSWPHVLAIADLTNDGRSDVAIATDRYFDPPNDQRLHLFAQQVNGTLVRTQRLSAGTNPDSIATLDLNVDGRLDVVTALASDDALAAYPQSASGALDEPTTLALPGSPNALATGDFTGDLRADLAAVAPLSSTIRLWQSSPQGLVARPFALPYPTGGFDALAAGDFNNDGEDDIAALRGAGYTTNAVVVYLQDSSSFPTSFTLSLETGGFLPHSLAVGDVNNDGRDDVVATAGGNMPNAYLNVFLQGEAGLATTPVTYPAFHIPSAVAVADVNHDGRQDVVALHDGWRSLSVYTQTTSGTLNPYTSTEVPFSDRYRPQALAVADLDSNGGLDIAFVDRDHGLTLVTNTLTPPIATIGQPGAAAVVMPGALTISGSTGSGTSSVEVRVRGLSDWTPVTLTGGTWQTSVTLPPQERAWWVEARATNGQGVVQAPVAQHRIGVESGPPQGKVIINDGADATNQPSIILTLPATDVSGVESMRLSLDGTTFTDWLPYNPSYVLSVSPEDGLKTVFVQFSDGPGNISPVFSDTIILDTVLPTSAIAPLPANTEQTNLSVSWSGEDGGSGVATFDIEIVEQGTGNWTSVLERTTQTETIVQVQGGRTYCFRSRAIDRAENLEAWPEGHGDACVAVQVATPTSTETPTETSTPEQSETPDTTSTPTANETPEATEIPIATETETPEATGTITSPEVVEESQVFLPFVSR